jgi:hypothetical protein
MDHTSEIQSLKHRLDAARLAAVTAQIELYQLTQDTMVYDISSNSEVTRGSLLPSLMEAEMHLKEVEALRTEEQQALYRAAMPEFFQNGDTTPVLHSSQEIQ